ncbi:hypothetical protein IQ07DRAFT_338372 [Pyrenochaeta sp. DS3sAY3a]|nr:hypothetical protein IQ07DRAFT_340016 [Pyrenochaeta sp. DS3sAY3a]OAL42768.1 hypothetical protein IQ07DRAFT_338372 [Pyrenochaeta sp. DS3sAY3a]
MCGSRGTGFWLRPLLLALDTLNLRVFRLGRISLHYSCQKSPIQYSEHLESTLLTRISESKGRNYHHAETTPFQLDPPKNLSTVKSIASPHLPFQYMTSSMSAYTVYGFGWGEMCLYC